MLNDAQNRYDKSSAKAIISKIMQLIARNNPFEEHD